jgi:hypothetical protein
MKAKLEDVAEPAWKGMMKRPAVLNRSAPSTGKKIFGKRMSSVDDLFSRRYRRIPRGSRISGYATCEQRRAGGRSEP